MQYDYIIAGAGLAGLSLAWKFIHSPALAHSKLLVIDEKLSPENDKTWSFWSRENPLFEDVIYKSWNQAQVAFNGQSILRELEEYTYHSIHSKTFATSIIDELRKSEHVDLLKATVREIEGTESKALLKTAGAEYTASYIFQSCLIPPQLKNDAPRFPLIQHFLGWQIVTSKRVFDASTITLMDFDPNFSRGIAFIYILPKSPNRALLEYTIFSNHPEQKEFYEEKLTIYLHNRFKLHSLEFNIERTEYGQIPMQDCRYAPRYAPRVINMGTVGGLTKPSTGYTFSRIQQHTDQIVKNLENKKPPALPYRSPFRYRAYDLWLLQIIHDQPKEATQILQQLFTNNSMDDIFRFLAEENTLAQDLKTMSRLSYPPFLRAIWKTRKRLFEI